MTLDEAIRLMTDAIVAALADNSSSIYLYGSVALGDFKPGWSDIDILVLTEREVSQEQADALVGLRQMMLDRYLGNPYFRQFEGGMLSLEAFLNNKPERVVYWGTSGQRITDCHHFDHFSMAGLLDSAILLCGADVRSKMTYPTYGGLRGDVARHYDATRKYAQTTGRSIRSYGWLLDIARCVYTLRTGKIIAKTAAGEWALKNGICPVLETLCKAIEVRQDPLASKTRDDILNSAERLGTDIQRFADVLRTEFASTANLFAETELREMSIDCDALDELQFKDGVSIWRVHQGEKSLVLKCFDKPDHRREMRNYRTLTLLGIPTLKIIAHTDCALLMEDIEHSAFRLGTKSDLNDPAIAALIAAWYRELHKRGREYAQSHSLYDECDVVTREITATIKRKTNTADLPVWTVVDDNFEQIKFAIMGLPRTLTYNDFYYTNLAVARDDSIALMFDYNLLGKGYIYSDIRNVCSSLGDEAKTAFLAAYREFDKAEIVVDNVASVLTTLYFACERDIFPHWAAGELEKVHNGELLRAVKNLLGSA